jgi:hypothetical protein
MSWKRGLNVSYSRDQWHTFDGCGTSICFSDTGYFDGYEISSDGTYWTTHVMDLHENI